MISPPFSTDHRPEVLRELTVVCSVIVQRRVGAAHVASPAVQSVFHDALKKGAPHRTSTHQRTHTHARARSLGACARVYI